MASQLSLLFLVVLTAKSQILPARCGTIKQQCVGEGSTCSAQWSDNCESWNSQWSVCQKCADNTLICHGGQCMKRTQGRGETCDTTQHLWCQPQFSCSGTPGYCYDPNTVSQPNSFAARGETCQSDSDCGGSELSCDPFIHKCVNPYIDSVTQEALCYNWADCQWNEYCSPADNTASPSIAATCKTDPGGFGNRDNALCKPAPGTNPGNNYGNPTGQCGWTEFCVQNNEDEYVANHIPYTATTCQRPYSIPEGGMCPPDIPAGYVYMGPTSNSYAISFCASGPCVPSGNGGNLYRCAAADYTYAGTGCRQDDECGRGMFCGCPDATGGGRYRCMPDNTHQDWEHGRQSWFQDIQPWFSCLEAHQCTLNSNSVGSCGYTHCNGALNWYTQGETTCTTGTRDAYYIDAPNYKGYSDTIGAGCSLTPSLLFATTLLALLYALIQ